ncbi:MAG: hypothetical protein RL410_1154 [Actinomycetota bacterium]
MSDCLFCKIASGEIPSNQLFSDDHVVAFHDIAPEAPHHFLVIPRKHFSDAADLSSDPELSAHLFAVATRLAEQEIEGGYRLVFNTGANGGQTVFHAHMHVLGGRGLQWPPG